MNRQHIKKAIAAAVTKLNITELSDEELGIDKIEEIARQSEQLSAMANESAVGLVPKKLFGGMNHAAFRDWLKQVIAKQVKELICGKVYTEIDTPEERAEIIKKYTERITDAIVAAYPPLALAKPLIRHLVAWFLARGLALAAQNLDQYCAVE